MLGKIRLSKFRWLSLPFQMNMNYISRLESSQVKSSQIKLSKIKSNQIKSYTHIWETENGNKGNDHTILILLSYQCR